ncbi:MAG: sulfite exporter TauE/SafE family protein [Myxococcales bacterium]|nr:sulfite exporter TauE/SafE family protein [Myxococcales bacterium]
MTLLEAVAITLAGLGAGTVNAVVGSGTLITFPVLLAFGYDPLVANMSNNLGLVPGSVSGSLGYRQELVGESRRLLRLGVAALLGGALGACLLLWLPPSAFRAIVPAFVALAIGLVAVQPWLSSWLARRRPVVTGPVAGRSEPAHPEPTSDAAFVFPALVLAGAYGGYFGAGQGILYIAILAIALPISLQRANALKNVLGALVNLVAGLVFIVSGAPIDWRIVALVALGATIGGQLGAHVGRRLSPMTLRAIIIVVGCVAFWRLIG